jgi:peptidyl-dipeptidase Dcp
MKTRPLGSLPKKEKNLLRELSQRLGGWTQRDFCRELNSTIRSRRKALEEIVTSPAPPTFDNTCLASELADLAVDKVGSDFQSLLSAIRPKKLATLERRMSKAAAHMDAADLADNRLAMRMRHLKTSARNLDKVQKRLVEDYCRTFVKEGYFLSTANRRRISGLQMRLAALETDYSKAQVKEPKLVHTPHREDLEGLSPAEVAEARLRSKKMGRGGWAISLEPTLEQSVTVHIKSPEFRRRIHRAASSRGRLTGKIASRIVHLRHRIAKSLGFGNWAEYRLAETFARRSSTIWSMLRSESASAQKAASRDLLAAQAAGWLKDKDTPQCALSMIPSTQDSFKGFDAIRVLESGCFSAANRLFGLRFEKVSGVRLYHKDIATYRVSEGSGETLGFITLDPWLRAGKDDGAWASHWVTDPGTYPIAGIFLNSSRAGCSFEEVKTVFHEFGHALHALFSFGPYPSYWGLEMPSDFAEVPSQLAESWATNKAIYALYAPENAPPLQILSPKKQPAGAGLRRTALLISSAADLIIHTDRSPALEGADQLASARLGLGKGDVFPRYKSTFFEHIFNSGYDAGYYSYVWCEAHARVLEKWTARRSGLRIENGEFLRKSILAPGGSLRFCDLPDSMKP